MYVYSQKLTKFFSINVGIEILMYNLWRKEIGIEEKLINKFGYLKNINRPSKKVCFCKAPNFYRLIYRLI